VLVLAAIIAAPTSADELALVHPADLCVERAVDAELGATFVDVILAAAELADMPADFVPRLTAIYVRCLSQHGEPPSDGRMVGGLVTARAMRNEAGRRLQARGVDLIWLAKAVQVSSTQADGDLTRTSEAVYAMMQQDPPEGLALDVEDGTESSRLTGVLVHAYVSGMVQAENWTRLIRG
jgi:hypothetical protein